MTNDVGPACSKSKPRQCGNKQRLLVEEAQAYALLPCAGVPSPALAALASSIRPQQQHKMVTFLWCFFAGLFRFPISYFYLPFQDSVPNS